MMNIYSIVPPFEDSNLPLYSRWSICAHSIQIINAIDSHIEAERILKLILKMDEQQILSQVLAQIGMTTNNSPFTADQIENAYDLFEKSLLNLGIKK